MRIEMEDRVGYMDGQTFKTGVVVGIEKKGFWVVEQRKRTRFVERAKCKLALFGDPIFA